MSDFGSGSREARSAVDGPDAGPATVGKRSLVEARYPVQRSRRSAPAGGEAATDEGLADTRPAAALEDPFDFYVCGVEDQSQFDALVSDARFLQPGEIHGNTDYKNKSGDLPAGTTYKEYDTATYKGDPKARGSDRIVVGANGKKYYTANHYKDFAEFD